MLFLLLTHAQSTGIFPLSRNCEHKFRQIQKGQSSLMSCVFYEVLITVYMFGEYRGVLSTGSRPNRCINNLMIFEVILKIIWPTTGEDKKGYVVLHTWYEITVRLLTHVLCKPTHFFFHPFIVTMSYSLQTSSNSLMKDWADKYHVWGTPTRSPSRSNSR